MTIELTILNNLKKLPESMQKSVLMYTEFLITRTVQQSPDSPEEKLERVPAQRGGLGIWKDKIWVADDFYAPLDDFQGYM
ncbi:MAG: DUF2281 domain-containing protein [Cyanobacteria bacterium P01_H01_bin.15]